MRAILKIITAPFALALTLLYGFFKFVVLVGGTIITIIAVLGAILSIAAMFFSGFWNGLAWLALAAIIFALPTLAALLVGALAALNGAMWGFIKS